MIDLPDNEVPKRREIVQIGLQFMDGEVCECTYPFQVLPKGHGRLIDADAEIKKIQDISDRVKNRNASCLDVYDGEIAAMRLAPTIIEADKGEEEC